MYSGYEMDLRLRIQEMKWIGKYKAYKNAIEHFLSL
jgi:hypothetical protein